MTDPRQHPIFSNLPKYKKQTSTIIATDTGCLVQAMIKHMPRDEPITKGTISDMACLNKESPTVWKHAVEMLEIRTLIKKVTMRKWEWI